MADFHKKLIDELDAIIKKAPDVDVDVEFGHFLKKYEKELKGLEEPPVGMVPRLIFLMDFLRFQTNVMMGGDLKDSLQSLLIWAEKLEYGHVPVNFANRSRMQKMADILEAKARSLRCSTKDQMKKWAQ